MAVLLLAITVQGQELSVKSFGLDERDASAKTQSRLDINNETCALLKVKLAVPNAKFSGNIIGGVEQRSGVYWVYVTSGTRLLQIHHSNYLALDVDLKEFGLRGVKGGKTYVLEVDAVADTSGKTQLVIQCTPKTATVIVDSKMVAPVNGVATTMVGEGKHKYVVTAKGYAMSTGEVLVEAGSSRVVTVRLDSKELEQMSADELFEAAENLHRGRNGMALNWHDALVYYRKAAAQGHVKAQSALGDCYRYGYGTEVDKKEAAHWYEQAANQGDAKARCQLGKMLLEGNGVKKDVARAAVLIEQAAGQGLPEAMGDLADLYADGNGKVKDESKAIALYQQAAGLGDVRSMFMVGSSYYIGKYGLPVDKAKAREWLQKSADLGFEYSKKILMKMDSTPVSLTIKTPNATLYIDGEKQFCMSGLLETTLTRGEHTYRLEAPGYETSTGKIVVGDEKVYKTLWLASSMATLEVGSDTQGIQIYVNDTIRDVKSWKGTVPPGTYRVEGRLYGHKSYSVVVDLGKRQERRVIVPQLQPLSDSPESDIPDIQEVVADGVRFNMVRVKGGTFVMGGTGEQGSDAYSLGDKERPHLVTVSDFAIGETEVTQELWQAVMCGNPSKYKGAQRPVEMVSWNDCQTFINLLNLSGYKFRLPTEAEWEYAARGGQKSRGTKYSGSANIDDVAWYAKPSNRVATTDVKKQKPNELGIYDMSGNVAEWCQDWYGSYSTRPQTNPTGSKGGSSRIHRGGHFMSDAKYCRTTYRDDRAPGVRMEVIGLRLVMEVPK